jgi:hypothetical protein
VLRGRSISVTEQHLYFCPAAMLFAPVKPATSNFPSPLKSPMTFCAQRTGAKRNHRLKGSVTVAELNPAVVSKSNFPSLLKSANFLLADAAELIPAANVPLPLPR